MSKAIPIMQLKERQYIYDGVKYTDIPHPHSRYLCKWVPTLMWEGYMYKQENIIAETKLAMLLENPITKERKWHKKSELALLTDVDYYEGKVSYNDYKTFDFKWELVPKTVRDDCSEEINDYREIGEELLGIEDLC